MIIADKYFIDDIESGQLIQVSKDQYEQYNKTILEFMEVLRPKLLADSDSQYRGQILITGTASDLETGNLEILFTKPDKYGFI